MTTLRYTKTHEWLQLNEHDMTIGITAHAQALLGDMVFVELPTIGKRVEAGEEIAVVESVKAASDVYAPISGVVVAVNALVTENPAIVNTDPYGDGWLFRIEASNPEECNELLTDEQYHQAIAKDH